MIEEVAAYVDTISLPYQTLSMITGQVAIVLLLRLHVNNGIHRETYPYLAMRDAILNVAGQLSACAPPEVARRHHWILRKATETLHQCITQTERVAASEKSSGSASLSDTRRLLHLVYRLLQLASRPGASLTAVDLRDACCNCSIRPSIALDVCLI